jgi:serine/threonine protein kinase
VPQASAGKRFGPYVIEGEIARGGQGAVYRATAPDGRTCALKMLTDRNPRALGRFRQEAKVLAALSHPNLLRVTDLGEQNGIPYLAMEYVKGCDLAEHVETGGVPAFDWSARLLGTVAHALHTCHAQGLVHRDLKPANVLVEEETDRPVLVDFGMVKRDPERMRLSSLESSPLSRTGELKGTPKYMAPEQAAPQRFGEVSPRTDVYALGACLYFLLTGQDPFEGDSLVGMLAKVIGDPPPNPRKANPEIPPALADFCQGCLSKQQDQRPESAEAFATELARLTGQEAALPRFPQSAAPEDPVGTPLSASDPKTLGPYTLLGLLGKGGMGAVYLGRHEVLGVVRAIKVLETLQGPKRTQRFQREINHLACVRHPHVISIHDSGHSGYWKWYAMDLIRGEPLDETIARGPTDWKRASQICMGIAQGAGALHKAGVVHRDLKPQNVVLHPDGRPVVIDLGLAIAPELDGRLTKTGGVVGTPAYMAPEQVRGTPPDPRTDVYATGLILYELLTGEGVVDPGSMPQVLAAVLNDPPTRPSELVPGLPRALDELCVRIRSKDPELRPADGNVLAQEFAPLCASGAGLPLARTRSWALRILAAISLMGIVAGAVLTAKEDELRTLPTRSTVSDDVPTAAPTPAKTLSPREIKAGDRALRKAKRVELPRARAERIVEWLKTYSESHPSAEVAKTLLREAQLRFPFRSLPGSRGVFTGNTHVLTREYTEDTLTVWNLETSAHTNLETDGRAIDLEPAAGPLSAFVNLTSGQIVRVSTAGEILTQFSFAGLAVQCLAVSPDGETLAVVGQVDQAARGSDFTCRILSSQTGEILREFELAVPGEVMDLAYTSDGTRLIACGGTELEQYASASNRRKNGAIVVDAKTGEELDMLNFIGRPNFVIVEPTSSRILVGTNGGTLLEYDVDTRVKVRKYVPTDEQLEVRKKLGGGTRMLRSAMDGATRGAAFSPDGLRIYSGAGEISLGFGSLAVWDRDSGKRLRVLRTKAIRELSLSPDGTLLAVSLGRTKAIDLYRTE